MIKGHHGRVNRADRDCRNGAFGGILLLYAFSADRGPIKDRLKTITGMMLWALEGGQMEPLARLCICGRSCRRRYRPRQPFTYAIPPTRHRLLPGDRGALGRNRTARRL